MHPKALLDEAGTELVRQVLRFEQPADAVVSRTFREQPQPGFRSERATLAETTYAVLRRQALFPASGAKLRAAADGAPPGACWAGQATRELSQAMPPAPSLRRQAG
jgi:hypothetical protein